MLIKSHYVCLFERSASAMDISHEHLLIGKDFYVLDIKKGLKRPFTPLGNLK